MLSCVGATGGRWEVASGNDGHNLPPPRDRHWPRAGYFLYKSFRSTVPIHSWEDTRLRFDPGLTDSKAHARLPLQDVHPQRHRLLGSRVPTVAREGPASACSTQRHQHRRKSHVCFSNAHSEYQRCPSSYRRGPRDRKLCSVGRQESSYPKQASLPSLSPSLGLSSCPLQSPDPNSPHE